MAYKQVYKIAYTAYYYEGNYKTIPYKEFKKKFNEKGWTVKRDKEGLHLKKEGKNDVLLRAKPDGKHFQDVECDYYGHSCHFDRTRTLNIRVVRQRYWIGSEPEEMKEIVWIFKELGLVYGNRYEHWDWVNEYVPNWCAPC